MGVMGTLDFGLLFLDDTLERKQRTIVIYANTCIIVNK